MTKSPAYRRYKEKHRQVTFQITKEEYEALSSKFPNINGLAKSLLLNSLNEDASATDIQHNMEIEQLNEKIRNLKKINEQLLMA